jgi:small multidrug resistance pump
VKARATILFFVCYWTVGVAAGLCFAAGGTDAGHWWRYFLAGNALGITSTWFLIKIYARMNVNLAMLVAGGGAFVIFQGASWLLFRAQVSLAQWAGILVVLAGMTLAMKGGRPVSSEKEPCGAPPQPDEGTAP